MEKELAGLELANRLSRQNLRRTLDQLQDRTSSVLLFTLQWKEIEEQFDSTRKSLEARAKEVQALEESVEKRVLELQKKEERLSKVEAREKELGSLHESIREKLRELEKKEKEFDLKQRAEFEKRRVEIELMEKHVKQLKSVQKSVDEKLKEFQRKAKELGSNKKPAEDSFKELKVVDSGAAGQHESNLKKMKSYVESSETRSQWSGEGFCESDSKFPYNNKEFELKEKKSEEWAQKPEWGAREMDERSIKELISTQKKPRLEFDPLLSSLTKERSNDDSLRPPAKKPKALRDSNPAGEMKETASARRLSENANVDGSPASGDAYIGEAEKNTGSVSEDILSSKDNQSQRCEAIGEGVFSSDNVDDVDNAREANDNPELLNYHDLEFSSFDKTMNSFAVNEVWAMYDPVDDMPRLYALVRKVNPARFKLQVTWLEPVLVTQCEESIPIACGEFEHGKTEETEIHLMFSHQMHLITCGDSVIIYPRKGETWALFRDWDVSWSTDTGKHKPPYGYEFVEVLSDLDEDLGIGVAYLGNVEGLGSVFKRAEQHGVIAFHIAPGEMHRFSHKVLSFRTTGKEKEGVPRGAFVLDPAALPNKHLGV